MNESRLGSSSQLPILTSSTYLSLQPSSWEDKCQGKKTAFSRALVSTPACCGSSAKKHPDLKDVATQDSQDDEWLEPVGMLRLSTG